jgi:hypothetical protein
VTFGLPSLPSPLQALALITSLRLGCNNIVEEENWAFKARLVPLFLMDWQAPMFDVMLEFLNTFLINGAYIYFGHKDKVYVISKQLIIDVFGVCVERYVEEPKG